MPLRRAIATKWQTVVEAGVLVAILVGIGVWVVPCHWTSTWADLEFTGWVVPIGNRVAAGQVLYSDGGHLPIPPLSFLISAWLFGADGTWIFESFLNFGFQCLTILALYFGMSHLRLPRPAPFLAALATIPLFAYSPKTIAYDAITQSLVALVAVGATAVALRPANTWLAYPLALGSAACLLSKQNTGMGALVGATAAQVFFPASLPFAIRLWRAGRYVATTALAVLVLGLAFSPWISLRGLLRDVFLTGAEPKGGVDTLLNNLALYGSQFWAEMGLGRVLGTALLLALGGALHARRRASELSVAAPSALEAAAVAGAAIGAIWLLYAPPPAILRPGFSFAFGTLPASLLWTGLSTLLVLVISTAIRAFSISRSDPATTSLAVLGMVSVPAAVFHSLSVPTLRWTYDNNPLIAAALAALILCAFRSLDSLPRVSPVVRLLLALSGALALQVVMWTTPGAALDRVRSCTERWPEVPYLAGATLAPRARGMRRVVRLVKRFAPRKTDAVLLLPSDPNVESWFARPRPPLQGAIVFVDQYWDRFVDGDFARIASALPKVIVIGPRYKGRLFQRHYRGAGSGAARLLQRVEQELLPQHYRLRAQQEIAVGRHMDLMDVYVRVDRRR